MQPVIARPKLSMCQPHHHLPCCRLGQALAHQCAIGFSGIVFGLIVIDNSVSHATSRSIFGLFSVPARVYPWALMVLWQLLLPSVSFLGHLTGIMVSTYCSILNLGVGCHMRATWGRLQRFGWLHDSIQQSHPWLPAHAGGETDLLLQVGECWVKGWLKHVTPSLACLEALEGRPFLSRLVMQPNYCPCSAVGGSSLASALPTSFGAGLAPGRGQQQVAQVGRLPHQPGALREASLNCVCRTLGTTLHPCILNTIQQRFRQDAGWLGTMLHLCASCQHLNLAAIGSHCCLDGIRAGYWHSCHIREPLVQRSQRRLFRSA